MPKMLNSAKAPKSKEHHTQKPTEAKGMTVTFVVKPEIFFMRL
jgi:hypothetical protein